MLCCQSCNFVCFPCFLLLLFYIIIIIFPFKQTSMTNASMYLVNQLQAGYSFSTDLLVFSPGYFQLYLFLYLWQVATAALLAVVASVAGAQSSLPVLNSIVDIGIALVTIGMVMVSRGSALAGQRLCRAARPLCPLSPYTISACVLLFSRSCHLP